MEGLQDKSLQELLDEITGADSKPSFQRLAPTPIRTTSEIDVASYDVPVEAVYDRTSRGTYTPRFENYKTAFGNEDRLAREQTRTEQWARGANRLLKLTGAHAVDSVFGTVQGLMQGIQKGSLSAIWDNELSNALDDYRLKTGNRLKVYKTKEEQDLNFLQSMGTASFWAGDAMDGLAFITGAVAPDMALGVLTGGISAPASIAKGVIKYGGKGLAKKGLSKLGVEVVEEAGKQVLRSGDDFAGKKFLRSLNKAAYAKNAGNFMSTAGFLIRSSTFEAGMEARHNFKEGLEAYITDFKEVNGRLPSADEMSSFSQDAVRAANGVFVANMGILAVSNAVMFGKSFNVLRNVGKKLNNFGNGFIGLGYTVDAAGKIALQEATRAQKLAGNAYKILSKPAVEGLYEEGLQGVAGTAMQNYLKAKYDPSYDSSYGVWASLTDAFAHQYTSKEGWKEIGLGMILGSLGPMVTLQSKTPEGIGKGSSYKSKRREMQEMAKKANEASQNLHNRLGDASVISEFGDLVKTKSEMKEGTSYDNAILNAAYIKAQEYFKPDSEIIDDFNTVIDNMELSEDEVSAIGGQDALLEYRETVKEEFGRHFKNYKEAKRAVEAIGFEQSMKGEDPGNIALMREAVMMQIMTGREGLDNAQKVAEKIDALIGTNGIYDALNFYSGLDANYKYKVNQVRAKQNELKEARELAVKYANELSGVEIGPRVEEQKANSEYKKASEKYTASQLRVNELQSELSQLEKDLEGSGIVEEFDIAKAKNVSAKEIDILSAIEEVNKLDVYVEALRRNGKEKEARSIEKLVEEYKLHSDAFREMSNLYNRLLDSDFFNSKLGKSYKKTILGDKYTMSEELRGIIRDNDQVIDKALRVVGHRSDETVEEQIQRTLADNPGLSDRQKFRLESMLRLQFGYEAMMNRVKEIEEEAGQEITDAQQDISNDPLKGDTVVVRKRTQVDPKKVSTLQILKDTIKQVTTELNLFKQVKVTDEKIKLAKEELNTLRESEKEEDKARVEELKATIKDLEDSRGDVDVASGEDFNRLEELYKKRTLSGLTREELDELNQLEEDIDDWILMSGTVFGGGIRLSDLVLQKIVLETVEPTPVEDVEMATSQEALDSAIPDKRGNANYALPQSYGAVTVVGKGDKLEISGITLEAFLQEAGIPDGMIEMTKDGKPKKGQPIQLNELNNIVVTKEFAEQINSMQMISIGATNKDLTTNYSVVLKLTPQQDGTMAVEPLASNFTAANEEFTNEMNVDHIYEMLPESEITFEVDPKDKYNVELLRKYKNAKKESSKENALKNLKKGLVIRVVHNGRFVGVLKSKRPDAKKNKAVAEKFEGLRDQVINDQGFFDSLLENLDKKDSRPMEVAYDGEVTVKNIRIGFPNFNYSRNEDGTMSVEYRPLTPEDMRKVEDVGYVQKGKTELRSGKSAPNLTFLKKSMERSPDSKIPFIVVSKGNTRIAIPVRLAEDEVADLTEFEAIYRSDTDPSNKAASLNAFMAKRGLDVKKEGNSFVVIGESSNLNDEFFSQKLADLEGIKYFRDLNEWVNTANSMEQILSTGVSTNVNLSSPVHSPKFTLNFDNLEVEVSEENEPDTSETKEKTSNNTLGKFDETLNKARKKKC